MRLLRPAVTLVVIVVVAASFGVPVQASSESAVRWTSFSESSTCGRPYVGMPIMSTSGILPESERILGPMGTYFGRSIAEVRSRQVWWTVPMSGGRRVLVHESSLPAFQQVTANLADVQAAGRFYSIESVAAFVPRTINGVRQLSRHGLGTAIDINPSANPYTADPDRMVTDMPDWFVQAWRDAGFCWGGDWENAKDPMHFAWMGPGPNAGSPPPIGPPAGTATGYGPAATYPTAFGDLAASSTMVLADAGGFGAVDPVRVRQHPSGTVMEVVPGRSGFDSCSTYRWFIPGVLYGADLTGMGDIDGDARNDLVTVWGEGDVIIRTATRGGSYEDVSETIVSGAGTPAALAIGDLDDDRIGDLFLVDPAGTLTVWAGPGFGDVIHQSSLPAAPDRISVADRDGDGTVELFAITGHEVEVLARDGEGWSSTGQGELRAADPVAAVAADQDGDGRADLVALDGAGELSVVVGNTATGRLVDGWWHDPLYECPDDPVPLVWNGRFYDDDTSEFEGDIELVASLGITRGCNPPFGDAYCPLDNVTRGQMAAFLVRALGLAPSDTDRFGDDDDSEFQADINALAAAGITRGCTDTSFCPTDPVSRGQMAAFLTRAYRLADVSGNRFVDDDQSIFENDIERLAAVGVTRGCNPPTNDRFCPGDPVTRGQMAAFLGRSTQID